MPQVSSSSSARRRRASPHRGRSAEKIGQYEGARKGLGSTPVYAATLGWTPTCHGAPLTSEPARPGCLNYLEKVAVRVHDPSVRQMSRAWYTMVGALLTSPRFLEILPGRNIHKVGPRKTGSGL